jgi:hypothetical protein
MQFYNPAVTFKGSISCDNAPTADNHLARKQDVAGLSYISAIASDSSSMLTVTNGELALSSLAITDVHVDSTQTSLANFIANESTAAAALREGDVLILTAPSAGTETYIVSGANGSSAGNYTQIESPLTAAEVGGVLQAGDGISVNASNATISANIAAGTGLSSSVAAGQITFALNADSDDISEGSSNLYFTNARARSAISAEAVLSPDGNLLQYNSSTGAFKVLVSDVVGEFSAGTGLSYDGYGEFSLNATTSDVSEGTNLYFTDARARAAISAGTGIAYNSSTGVVGVSLVAGTAIGISGATISFNGDSDDVSEGSSNLYYTDARSRSAISLGTAGAGDAQIMTYNNSTGAMGVLRSDIFAEFSGGTAIGFSAGVISFNGDSDDVSEGSSNQYFTNARARSAISAETVSAPDGNLLQYNSSTGALKVLVSDVTGEFQAGTGLSYDGYGEFSLNATTSDVAEGSNLYYTDARVRSAISAGSQSDELINYTQLNGSFSLRLSQLRYSTSVTLTANTPSTITHNLGEQLVHVSAMDASGNKIELDVVYSSSSALTIESAVGVTVTVAVSV